MATHTTTPTQRIERLLAEGVRFLAIHPGDPGIDVTHDITGLLEAVRSILAETEPAVETPPALTV